MTYTEKVLAEFEETMIEDWLDADSHSNKLPAKFNFADCQLIGELLNPRLKSFLATSISQAVAEERARVRAIINKLPTVNVKTYEEYGGIEIRGINHAEQLIPKYDLLTSLDKPLTDKE